MLPLLRNAFTLRWTIKIQLMRSTNARYHIANTIKCGVANVRDRNKKYRLHFYCTCFYSLSSIRIGVFFFIRNCHRKSKNQRVQFLTFTGLIFETNFAKMKWIFVMRLLREFFLYLIHFLYLYVNRGWFCWCEKWLLCFQQRQIIYHILCVCTRIFYDCAGEYRK